jgi:hypothetical protein
MSFLSGVVMMDTEISLWSTRRLNNKLPMNHWKDLLDLRDDELEAIDPLVLNLLVAKGIPPPVDTKCNWPAPRCCRSSTRFAAG